jgi:signal transduction histidine kinase
VPTTTTRRAFLQFVASMVAVVVVVGLFGVWLLHRSATREALDDARMETRAIGRAVVQPLITPGNRDLRAQLDLLFRRGALGERVNHAKVWTADGRVLYATEPLLIGKRFGLSATDRVVLDEGLSEADVSDLSEPENRFERSEGKLLEVYTGLRAPDGRKVLFETYRPYSLITENERRLRSAFAPTLFGAVLLLALLLLPLVLGLARRLERGQRDREALLRRALDASDRERTRVARELHDGPVQRLSGVAFALAGAERSPPETTDLRETIRAGAEQIRETVRELRGTLTDLYPPNLQRQGLAAALADLLAPLRVAGVNATLDVPSELRLRPDTELALFRAAQEATRNVLEHADAASAHVAVTCADDVATLEVSDDGVGFGTADQSEGHFGLRLLEDLARDHGGRLDVSSSPGNGTRLCFKIPA